MKAVLLILIGWPLAARSQALDLAGSPPSALQPPPPAPGENCSTVTAGSAVSFGCINAGQRALVEQHRAAMAGTTPGANTPAPAVGVFNQAATREHLGSNFGHSTIPQRPPPPHFTNPLAPR